MYNYLSFFAIFHDISIELKENVWCTEGVKGEPRYGKGNTVYVYVNILLLLQGIVKLSNTVVGPYIYGQNNNHKCSLSSTEYYSSP